MCRWFWKVDLHKLYDIKYFYQIQIIFKLAYSAGAEEYTDGIIPNECPGYDI